MQRTLVIVLALALAPACSTPAAPIDAASGGDGGGGDHDGGGGTDAGGGGTDSGGGGTDSGGGAVDAGSTGLPAGWLYTSGNHVFVSDGAGGGSVWVGRGVNMDDVFLCGYNYTLWDTSSQSELEAIAEAAVNDWHADFVRVSLGMASYPTETDWTDMPAQYRDPMTAVIDMLGSHAGTYVLVALRSHASMILQDDVHGDPEATGIPSDATTTPDATRFPTGTDATYVALVDTFAHDPYVLFGITNEAGGNQRTDDVIASAMQHAVDVIRAEEDRLGVPHHVVSVQGNSWTSDISHYVSSPITGDNVVYEIHGYPPTASSYTYATLPVIIGEYGSLPDAAAFYADVESKQIPNLAWDFEPFSDCSPDLLEITHDATMINASAWGTTVHDYLAAHAH
jgi:hypothetical protein